MSNSRRHRRAAGNERRVEARRVMRESLAVLGCTCRPDISRSGHAPGIHEYKVEHDDWCPLLAGGERTTFTLYRPGAA